MYAFKSLNIGDCAHEWNIHLIFSFNNTNSFRNETGDICSESLNRSLNQFDQNFMKETPFVLLREK